MKRIVVEVEGTKIKINRTINGVDYVMAAQTNENDFESFLAFIVKRSLKDALVITQ